MDTLFRFSRAWMGLPLLWLLAALACNAPIAREPAPQPPLLPTATPTTMIVSSPLPPSETPPAPATIPILQTATPLQEEATGTAAPLPTFTPIAQPTLAATKEPTNTATAAAQPATPRPTNTPTPASRGPLDFSYSIAWRLTAENPFMAVARVTIQATGGSGVYTYFHDDIQRSGPTFEYNWAACQGNPGSFRVDSSDGQSVRKSYFETAPCPTPTPSPSP
jgi:hypothetical protein